MWSLWKEVLLPGRQRDRNGNWFSFSAADIRQADKNVRKMIGNGVPVPTVWEHVDVEAGDSDAWKARYAKYTFGDVAGSRVNDRGALELLHRGTDLKDRDQLLKTKFVSPKVYPSYSDSRGGEYQGTTIAHVAATPTPVQFWQKPFELSQSGALYLSYEAPMPDDDKKEKPGKGEKEGGENEGGGELKALFDALREVGMNIPDEVTDIAGLIIAVKASGGAKNDADDDRLGEPGQEPGGNIAPAGGAPMMMSATDPRVKGYAKNERKELVRRVKRLFESGRIDRPAAAKLLRTVDAAELSFTREGDLVKPSVLHRIEAYEDLASGVAWNATGHRETTPLELSSVDAPETLTGGETGKGVVDFMCAGLPAKK